MAFTYAQISAEGSGAAKKFAMETDGTLYYPASVLAFGTSGGAMTLANTASPFPVTIISGTVTTVSSVTAVGTITPGTAASSLGKAEDAVHGSGDVGVFALVVRADTAASLCGTDGDYTGLIVDSSGRLHVNVGNTVTVAAHAVTNAGVFATQVDGSALTALQLLDDVVYADDGAWTGDVSKHALTGGIYQSSPQTITDGRTGPIQLTTNGYQIVNVNGTVAATQSGTWNITNVSGTISLPTGAATAAKQPALGAAGTASTDVITVQGIASMTPVLVTFSGTNNIATVTTVTTVSTVTTVATVTSLSQFAGQAINLGAGAVDTGTLRTTLGSNDPAVASLAIIDDWDSTDACKTVGFLTNPSANFTRPADTTAYAVGDLVANSTTAGSVVALSWTASRIATGSLMVRRVRLKKSGTTATSAQFRLHLYETDPAASSGIANGDNGAWSTKVAGYLGYLDVGSMLAFTDACVGVGQPAVGSEIGVAIASGSTIYGLIEARAAYTPASAEVFTAVLEVMQN